MNPCIALERILFGLAGTMTLVSLALAVLLNPWFLLLAVFTAANQWLFASVGACPASLVLSRAPFVSSRCGP